MSLDRYDFDKLSNIEKLQKAILDEQKKTNELLDKLIDRVTNYLDCSH